MLKWFESYLTGKSQYVVYDGIKSDIYNVTCGVPQGSILGPLLFILNMNDICNKLEVTDQQGVVNSRSSTNKVYQAKTFL